MTPLPLQLSEASGVPFYRQIEEQIAGLIRSGALRPDEMLPSVRELAAQLLVSLITVRRAYADLEAAGLVVLRQGQGTFVAQAPATPVEALAAAREILAQAVTRARQLGLDDAAQRDFLERIWGAGDTAAQDGGGHGG